MSIKEISFASANGRDTVKAWRYTPLGQPKAVVQIVHGFGEHSRRYTHMINAFNAAGYVVYADDHIGHGKTGYDGGTMGDPHSGGYKTYLKDEKTLHDIAAADFPDLPFFMFGHSWGSMLGRAYAALYGEDLTGLMLCGVVCQMKGAKVYYDPAFQEAYKTAPYEPAGMWFVKAFDGMVDRIEGAKTGSEWIGSDEIVADHAGDMFNTFNTTFELVYDLVAIGIFIDSDEWAPMVPNDLPVYLIAGDQDPCGNYGEGLYHCANLLAESGNKVRVKAYPGYRHEIHNYPDIRDEVEAGLIKYIEDVLNKTF